MTWMVAIWMEADSTTDRVPASVKSVEIPFPVLGVFLAKLYVAFGFQNAVLAGSDPS